MDIEIIREKVANKISENHEEWSDILNDTNPGHYGASYWEVEIKPNDVWVDIPNRVYTFKNAQLLFTVRLGETGKDGMDMDFSKVANGKGKFQFSSDGQDIELKELEIEVDLDLFD